MSLAPVAVCFVMQTGRPTDVKTNYEEKQYNITLGQNLRQMRHFHGMKQKELAVLLQITSQQVQKCETGINRISPRRLAIVKATFNVSWDTLMPEIRTDEKISPTPLDPRTGPLSACFNRIPDETVRRHIYQMVKGLAG